MMVTLFVLIFALLLSFFFSGYETGFTSCNRIRVRHRALEENIPAAKSILRHLDRPSMMLSTLLVGNNLANMAITVEVARQFREIGIPQVLESGVAILLITPALLVFCEIIPKSVFRTHPNRLTLALLPVLQVFYYGLAPLTWPLSLLTSGLLRTVGGENETMGALMTSVEDVRTLVDEGAAQGTIQQDEQRMIHSVFDLHGQQATEIMVPRIDIQGLPDTATRDELIDLLESSGRTRIPIYHETIDEIIGVANAHDVLLDDKPEEESIQRFIHPVLHVPDTIKLDTLFTKMKTGKHHMAIVTDEYGGTDGLITIEDIIEEIFGEIQDEHDTEEHGIHQVGPRAFVIDARASLDEASQSIGMSLNDEEVDTVGGWVVHMAGRIPNQGDVIDLPGFRITVLEGGPTSVTRIRLELTDDTREEHGKETVE